VIQKRFETLIVLPSWTKTRRLAPAAGVRPLGCPLSSAAQLSLGLIEMLVLPEAAARPLLTGGVAASTGGYRS